MNEREYNEKMKKDYEIEIYPTRDDEELLWERMDACRFVWNYMLCLQEAQNENGEKYLSVRDMEKLLISLTNNYNFYWLHDTPLESLKIICEDLSEAIRAFRYESKPYPEFRSKKDTYQCYPVSSDGFFFGNDYRVFIAFAGDMKYGTGYTPPKDRKKAKYSNIRVFSTWDKWLVSFSVECDDATDESNIKAVSSLSNKSVETDSEKGK